MIKWILEFAKFLRFIRDGVLVARRHRPEELQRYLAI
jgi:hypothetical protein